MRSRVGRAPKREMTPLPDDFGLTPEMREYAVKLGIPATGRLGVDETFEAFKDAAIAKGYVYKDWVRAWYSWARNNAPGGRFAPDYAKARAASMPDRLSAGGWSEEDRGRDW